MNLLTALVVGVLFGSGVYLMTREDVSRLVAGTVLLTNSAILLLVSAGFRTRVLAPQAEDLSMLADPLVQALALTAVVINFGTTVLLLCVMVAVESTHDTLSTEDLVRSEVGEERAVESADDEHIETDPPADGKRSGGPKGPGKRKRSRKR